MDQWQMTKRCVKCESLIVCVYIRRKKRNRYNLPMLNFEVEGSCFVGQKGSTQKQLFFGHVSAYVALLALFLKLTIYVDH